jgi:hypothetical protein
MKLEYIIIGILFFGFLMQLGVMIIADGVDKYDIPIDTSSKFGKIVDEQAKMYGYVDDMKTSMQGESISDTDAVNQMVAGAYKGIRTNPFTAVTVLNSSLVILQTETPFISPGIISFLIISLTVIMSFLILAIVFRFWPF